MTADHIAELLRASGIALSAVVCILVLGHGSGGLGFAVRIGGALLIMGIFVSMLSGISDTLGGLLSATENGGFVGEAFSLMLKSLGIAMISKLCSDVCRDCGENTLASGVDSVGRAAIIMLCLPVIARIVEYASDFLAM